MKFICQWGWLPSIAEIQTEHSVLHFSRCSLSCCQVSTGEPTQFASDEPVTLGPCVEQPCCWVKVLRASLQEHVEEHRQASHLPLPEPGLTASERAEGRGQEWRTHLYPREASFLWSGNCVAILADLFRAVWNLLKCAINSSSIWKGYETVWESMPGAENDKTHEGTPK